MAEALGLRPDEAWNTGPERIPSASSPDAFVDKLDIIGISRKDIDKWIANDGKAQSATAKKYNECVKNGFDPDFGNSAEFMKTRISGTGPHCIIEQPPRFAKKMGGVVADETLQAVDKAGEPRALRHG